MYRVNVNGTVLALNGESLLDLLCDIRSSINGGYITRCPRGYVVDGLGKACVLVNVTPLAVAS